jgi:FlaA1/EpsC-like NDP-sugar epimerase
VVGFLDPDHAKKNLCIHSIPVRGSLENLDQLSKNCNIRAVLLTSSTTQEERNHLQAECRRLGLGRMRIKFELEELVSQDVTFWEDFFPQEALAEPETVEQDAVGRRIARRKAIRLGGLRDPSSKAMQ